MMREVSIVCSLLFVSHEAFACGYGEPDITETTLFDPSVWPKGPYFDPGVLGFGEACEKCVRDETLADWKTYLDAPHWEHMLFDAALPEVDQRIFALQKSDPQAKEIGALFYVGFAKRVPSTFVEQDKLAEAEKLQKNGEKAAAKAKDAFLKQRYELSLLRLRFYRRDFAGVIANKPIDGPSRSLQWRAKYYVAGALMRTGKRAEANVALAKIYDGAPFLSTAALNDFAPMERADWDAALALATSNRDKALLWHMVGLKKDGIAAMREIEKLEPGSDLLPLLAVREVNMIETGFHQSAQEFYPLIEKLRGGKNGALYSLILAHAATTLPETRAHLQKAKPGPQANAILALALARAWKAADAKLEDELMKALAAVPATWSRRNALVLAIRRALAASAAPADVGFFDGGKGNWTDVATVEAMIARVQNAKTPFEKFRVESQSHERLENELGMLHASRGNWKTAAEILKRGKARLLGTDPFVIHIKDCHDCDHDKYGPTSKWTDVSFAARMAELQQKPEAAMEFGHGLYNITWHGNARSFFEASHYATSDASQAEAAYKQAFELAKDRETKTRAAYYAAKAERGSKGDVPTSWYGQLKGTAGSKFYKEVLRECGYFRAWVSN